MGVHGLDSIIWPEKGFLKEPTSNTIQYNVFYDFKRFLNSFQWFLEMFEYCPMSFNDLGMLFNDY